MKSFSRSCYGGVLIVVLACAFLRPTPLRAATCTDTACVEIGGRLASIDSQRSVLLNALLGQMLGSQVTLSAADWQSLANAQINLLDLLQAVQAQASLGTPDQALTATLDAAALFNAAASALQARGNTAAASAVLNIAAHTSPGALRLSELIDLCTSCLSFADVNLNALDFVGGSAALFNYDNALSTPTPIAISGSALGLGSIVSSIQLYAQVLEQPRIVCRTAGAQFYGSAIRVKLDAILVNTDLSAALSSRLATNGVTLPLGVSALQAQLSHLTLFASIARAQGILQSVDALAQAVTVQARPGIVDLYVGQMDDAVFFDRYHTISPSADLQFGNIGALQVNLSGVPVSATLRAKTWAEGEAPFNSTLYFTGPYPQKQTVSTSALFVANLTSSLLSNLQLDVQITSPALVNAATQTLFDTLWTSIRPSVLTVYQSALNPVLSTLLTSVVDPMLALLGIRLGEADVTVLGARRRCTYTVAGSVYRDANRNGFKDGAETGTGLAFYAKLVADSAPSGPALQAVPVDPTSGAFSFSNVAGGSYRIVIDDNATLTDLAATTLPSGWTATEQGTFLRVNVAVTSDLTNENFGLASVTTLAGRVFRDSGTGGGTANDGICNGGELGIAGVTVRLLDASDAVLDTATTGGDGRYQLFIPTSVAGGATLRVVETNLTNQLSTGASVGTTSGSYDRASDTIGFTHAAGNSYTGVDFGDVPSAQFTTDGQQSAAPGTTVYFPHEFVAGTAGTVTFATAHASDPVIAGWTGVVYLDANANGQVDAGEQPATASIAVSENQALHLVVKIFVPTNAPYNARDQSTLRAEFALAGAAPALAQTLTRTDLTVASSGTTAGLMLVKSVDKTSARPGETIIYTITFTNQAASSLHNVVVFDATPSFTLFVSAAASGLPAGFGPATITAPAIGASGAIRWEFAGELAPGASGTVMFTVGVEQ